MINSYPCELFKPYIAILLFISSVLVVGKVFFTDSVRSIEADLLTDKWKNPFSMETFDVQLTCFGARDTGDKLDVCLLVKRDDDIPVQVLNVKRNEVKNAAFEVRCFHRYIIV